MFEKPFYSLIRRLSTPIILTLLPKSIAISLFFNILIPIINNHGDKVMKKLLTLVICAMMLASCATTGGNGTKTARVNGNGEYTSIEELIQNTDLDEGTDGGETGKHKIPRVINESVARWIDYFTKENRDWFQRALTRSEQYETDMKNILISSNVPEELFYLALIESAFVQHARSRAKAQGIWQFMPGTGKLYGLSVRKGNDERNEPYKATAAAAAYLKDLYNIYGSWYLAIASYNAGEGRIRNAILRHRERNFWELAAKNALPDETMNYVPKFIAAVIVAENYSKFGFAYNGPSKGATTVAEDVSKLVALEQYRRGIQRSHANVSIEAREAEGGSSSSSTSTYVVKRGDNLSRIAVKHGLTVAEIKKCNSRIKSNNSVNIGQKLVLGCSGEGRNIRIAKNEPKEDTSSNNNETSVPRFHRVRSGDTLEAISKKYGLTIDAIKGCNPTVKRYQILTGQKLKLTCASAEEEEAVVGTNVTDTNIKKVKKDYKVHVVRNGESLWAIAQKYNVSISDLMKWNNLKKRSVIFKGRRLRVYNGK